MPSRLCPSCQRPADYEALRCGACGVSLPQEDTVPAAFDATPRWTTQDQRPFNLLDLTLRPVDGEDLPPLNDPVTPVDLLIEAEPPDAKRLGEALALSSAGEAIRLQKTAKRAAVRRARLRRADPAVCTDVLVFDRDETASQPLCDLLGAFGFQVQVASRIQDAIAVAQSAPLAAAFVDVALDDDADGSAVELCQVLKAARTPNGAPVALMLHSAKVTPVGWIRAQMAGCDALIDKPARRGDVARALETCAVPLPADARRA